MEKEPRRDFFCATPIIFFLVLPLLYVDFYESNVVPFYQSVQQFSSGQPSLNSMKVTETKEEQDSGELSLNSREVNQTPQEQKSRPLSLSSRKVEEALQEHESEVVGTLEEKDSGPLNLSSGEVDEKLRENDFRPHSLSSRAAAETLHANDSGKICHGNRDFNKTVQESRQLSLSNSELSGTIREQKFSQLRTSNREVNVTTDKRRSFGTGEVNGPVESGQLILGTRNVHETEGHESRQRSPSNKENIRTTEVHGSRESLFTRLVRGFFSTPLFFMVYFYFYL